MRFIYERRLDTTPRAYRERFRHQQSGAPQAGSAVMPVLLG
jgi:hypothetical protein